MGDRFVRGLIAGFAAGVAMDALDLIAYWLKYDTTRYLDFAAVIAFGKNATNTVEVLVALLIELMFKAGLGVLFVFVVPKVKSKYLVVKAVFFGISNWFVIYSVIILFKATKFPKVDLGVTVSHLINSSVYGIVLALILYLMEDKIKSKNS